jgi:ferritin-like metal-binding protein YciE
MRNISRTEKGIRMSNPEGTMSGSNVSMSGQNANMANADEELQKKLITYLEDAYALENEIVRVLEGHIKDADKHPDVQQMIQRHLDETKQHRQRMEDCLNAYGKKPSAIKGAGTSILGGLMGAMSGGRTDTLAKNARDEYVTEHMEIAAYQMLITTAAAAGDQQTVQACQLNLQDEVRMAKLLEQHMPHVVTVGYQDEGIQAPMGSWSQAEQAGVNAVQRAE